jgi:hypothetical protein
MSILEEAIPEPRSSFLVFMTVLANVFLFAFALDASLSVADDLLLLLAQDSTLSAARNTIAGYVLIASVLMLLILLFVPHLPRRVFLVPALFTIWASIGAPPLSMSHNKETSLVLALIQLALAIFAFIIVRRRMDGELWLSTDRLPHKRFLILRSIAAVFSLLIFGFIALLGLNVVGIALELEKQSGGYVDFTWTGVDLQEKIMKKDDKTVHLVGMMHIGEPEAYIAIFSGFPKDSLVLAEGVTDRESKLGEEFSYSGAAEAIGLAQQPMLETALGVEGDYGDEDETESAEDGAKNDASDPAKQTPPKPRTHPDIVYRDVDVSEFNDVTIQVLKIIAKLYASESPNEAMKQFGELMEFGEDQMATVMDDIVTKRNARVLSEFDKRIGGYRTVVLPWGAMHMPGIEEELQKRGFTVTSERRIPIVRYNAIMKRWAATEGAT